MGDLRSARRPAWHAAQSRRLYRPLALYLAGRKDADPRQLATCWYRLGLYPRWEASLKTAGLTPAREVEKALRWDQKTRSCSGRGKDWVKAAVAKAGEAKAAAAQDKR